jgi:phage tail sheath gpL-like
MIVTSVPTTKKAPGFYQEFDTKAAARGLTPINLLLALVGGKSAAGTATAAKPIQVFTTADADNLFGLGSELALMYRAAYRAALKASLPPPQFWCVPIADAGGAVKATYTLTITGPATASGDLVVMVAGRIIRCGVATGDAQNTIAANLKTAFDKEAAKGTMPVVASVVTNVVTLTAVNAGPVGADIRVPTVGGHPNAPIAVPAGVTCVAAAGVAGTGAYDIQASLDALVDKQYHAMAFGTHVAGDITKINTHLDLVGGPGAKMWSSAFMGEYGSVSTETTLATNSNRMEVTIAGARDFPELPGEIAAHFACTIYCEADPARPFDGVELDLVPPPLTSVYIESEKETLLAAGVTPLLLNSTQSQAVICRWVTTATTVNGAPFDALLDGTTYRSLVYGATQIDIAERLAFGRAKANKKSLKRLYSLILRVLRDLEKLEIYQNIEAHKDEILVEVDPTVATRFNAEIPSPVVPGLHQIVGKHVLYFEAAR